MTGDEASSTDVDVPLSDKNDIQARASIITSSQTIGDQQFAYADVQIRVDDAAHKRAVEQQKLEHELQQERLDNDLRRLVFKVVIGILVVSLVVAAWIGIQNSDDETRRWAQNMVTTLIGGLLGAIAGYFTAKASK